MNIRNIIAENALAVFLKMLPDNIKTAWQFARTMPDATTASLKANL